MTLGGGLGCEVVDVVAARPTMLRPTTAPLRRRWCDMKAEIHPNYIDCKVSCACGTTFTTKSVKPEIRTDICADCHPFYTGAQKFVDTAGRVDKFRKRYARKSAPQEAKKD